MLNVNATCNWERSADISLLQAQRQADTFDSRFFDSLQTIRSAWIFNA